MLKAEDLAARLNAALNRKALAFDPADADGYRRLRMPPGGIALANADDFGKALNGGAKSGLAALLTPAGLGAVVGTPETLVLNALAIDTLAEPPELLIDVEWPGAVWTLSAGLITLHDPNMSLVIAPARSDAPEGLRGVLHGPGLAGGLAIDVSAALMPETGASALRMLDGNLAAGGPQPLAPLLGTFGLDGLPGLGDLMIEALSFASSPTENAWTFAFTLAADWSPDWGVGTFALRDPSFSITRDGDVFSGRVGAHTMLLNQPTEVSLACDGGDWTFSAVLTPTGEAATLGLALEGLGRLVGLGDVLADAPDFHKLSLGSISLGIGLSTHQLHVAAEIKGTWSPSWCDGFGVSALKFDILHMGGDDGSTMIHAEGDVMFGATGFALSAAHDGRDTGWTFEAALIAPLSDEKLHFDALSLPAGFGLGAGDLPIPADDFDILDMHFSFNTADKAMSLTLIGRLGNDADAPTIHVDVAMTPCTDGKAGFDKRFTGKIILPPAPGAPGMEFDLLFDKQPGTSTFVAAYQNHGGGLISVKSMVAGLVGDVAAALVPDMKFAVRDAALIGSKAADGWKYILSVALDDGISLSSLPLVSKIMPANQTVKIALQPLYSSGEFTHDDAARFQALLPPDGVVLAGPMAPGQGAAIAIEAGKFTLICKAVIGDRTLVLPLSLSGKEGSGKTPKRKPTHDVPGASYEVTADAPVAPGMTWVNIQKSMGPVHFDRVGFAVVPEGPAIKVAIDASFGAAGLTLSAMGLSATYSIPDKTLDFGLDGIGLAYSGGPTEISGSFLKLGDNDFVGEAMIRTASFAISALGGYCDDGDAKSLFVYGFLDYPIGGPPFFFVEGAAAGFGYNRRVRDISIDEVETFPFVAAVTAVAPVGPKTPATPDTAKSDLTAQLRSLDHWVHPHEGEHFLAIGVKFNSFRIIDAFALAMISFGETFRLDVLGIATAVLPPPPPGPPAADPPTQLAVIEMDIDARYRPEEGFLGVDAKLAKTSWVLSTSCHLTGGFAYYSWFDGPHSGDFVTTLGGYHPEFKVPSHYPSVDRLALQWKVSDHVEVTGSLYFALTPNAMMAGGHLEATWSCGDLWANFALDANFLMQWKPFHYEADLSIEISAGYGSLSGSLGASVRLHGPDFAGTARFHFLMVSFDVDFGDANAKPDPIPWPEFRDGFLPADLGDAVALTAATGVLRSTGGEDGKRWVMNAKEASFLLSSLVPLSGMISRAESDEAIAPPPCIATAFGIPAMNVTTAPVSTLALSITLFRASVNPLFAVEQRAKPYASAMWGRQGQGFDLDGGAILPVLGEATIRPAKPSPRGQTTQIPRRNLSFDIRLVNIVPPAHRGPAVAYPPMPFANEAAREMARDAVAKSVANLATRDAALLALGFDPAADIRMGPEVAAGLIHAPALAASASWRAS
jgi:hypothetical protein